MIEVQNDSFTTNVYYYIYTYRQWNRPVIFIKSDNIDTQWQKYSCTQQKKIINYDYCLITQQQAISFTILTWYKMKSIFVVIRLDLLNYATDFANAVFAIIYVVCVYYTDFIILAHI